MPLPPSEFDKVPPSLLAAYLPLAILGSTTTEGTVYLSHPLPPVSLCSSNLLAVKVLHHPKPLPPALYILRNAQQAASGSESLNTRFPKILDFGFTEPRDELQWYSMTLVQGTTLASLEKAGCYKEVTLELVMHVFHELLAAQISLRDELRFLHSDVRTMGNIMLAPKATPRSVSGWPNVMLIDCDALYSSGSNEGELRRVREVRACEQILDLVHRMLKRVAGAEKGGWLVMVDGMEESAARLKALARLAAGKGLAMGDTTAEDSALDAMTLDGLMQLFGGMADEVRRMSSMEDWESELPAKLSEGVIGKERFAELMGENVHH